MAELDNLIVEMRQMAMQRRASMEAEEEAAAAAAAAEAEEEEEEEEEEAEELYLRSKSPEIASEPIKLVRDAANRWRLTDGA